MPLLSHNQQHQSTEGKSDLNDHVTSHHSDHWPHPYIIHHQIFYERATAYYWPAYT